MAYGIVYKIENLKNKKVYIGITTSKRGFNGRYSASGIGIERVYNFYKYQKKNKQFHNIHLLRSIEKYGYEAFDVNECLEVAENKVELLEIEKKWIEFYKCTDIKHGYNRTAGGDSFLSGKDSPRYNSIDCTCVICGSKFIRNKSQYEKNGGRYCSSKCSSIGFGKEHMAENNHNYCKKPIKCNYCGKIIMRPSSLTNKTNYCDKLCQAKDYENRFAGSNNPNYGNHKMAGANNGRARKIICINTGEEFEFAKQAARKYNISYPGIISTLTGKQKTAGIHPSTGEPMKWKYKD